MMKKTIRKRVLALAAALALILCSTSVSAAADIAELKTEYIRDYTLLSPEDGFYTDKPNGAKTAKTIVFCSQASIRPAVMAESISFQP